MSSNSDIARTDVIVRADASTHLGSGHVMRCLTLAAELRRRGASVRFVCREVPGNLISRIESQGFAVSRLHAGTETEQDDARATLASCEDCAADWIVVDHYHLGIAWEQQVRAPHRRILVIEDLEGRPHDCDVLLDQNWEGPSSEDRHRNDVSPACLRLLGPRFALLQPDYARLRAQRDRTDGEIRRVFLFFGGADRTDETGKALAALSRPQYRRLSVDVVLGNSHPDPRSIEAAVVARPNTRLHTNLPSLASLMTDADVAIGAGGATSWERICLGLPALVTTLAPNQERLTEALAQTGSVLWIGRSTETSSDSYADALSSAGRVRVAREPYVDGLGAQRVGEVLLPTDASRLTLRAVQRADAALLFDWRNESATRAMSFSSEPLSWETHVEWLSRRLADADSVQFIAEANGLPVGQVRLQFEGTTAVLSYSLDPLARGRSWSRPMIARALDSSPRTRSALVHAHVKTENVASAHVFRRLGWQESANPDGTLLFRSH